MRRMPVSRAAWSEFYVKVFCRTGRNSAAHMACWYQLLDLADPGSA